MKREASEGLEAEGVCPIVLLLYVGLDFIVVAGAGAVRTEPSFCSEMLKAELVDRLDSFGSFAIRER